MEGYAFGWIGGTFDPVATIAFRPGAPATDGEDRIIYDPANGNLFYDPDGNGSEAAILFASLAGAPTIKAADIIVVGGARTQSAGEDAVAQSDQMNFGSATAIPPAYREEAGFEFNGESDLIDHSLAVLDKVLGEIKGRDWMPRKDSNLD